jgi:hypothetical protein
MPGEDIEFNEAAGELSDQLIRANNAIRSMKGVRVEASVRVHDGDDHRVLGFGKVNGAWGLYADGNGGRVPIADSTLDMRVLMAENLPELVDKILSARRLKLDKVLKAAVKAAEFADLVESGGLDE